MAKETRDFGELYRAAFAESDPDRRLKLMAEVNQALLEWEQTLLSGNVLELRKKDEKTSFGALRSAA